MRNDETLGADTDHYDAAEIFGDDDDKSMPKVSKEAVQCSIRDIIKQAQRLRVAPPPVTVEPAPQGKDIGEVLDDAYLLGELLGEVPVTTTSPAPFTPTDSTLFPITQKLYQKFKAAIPPPRVVRVDDEANYAKWKDSKRAPYIATLESRVEQLEANVADHVSDNHGHGRVQRLEDAFTEHLKDAGSTEAGATELIGDLVEKAKDAGDKIPLSLHPESEGKVDAWQDGCDIFCSIRLCGPDGKVRIATTSSPAERHADEVAKYASEAGVDPVTVMGVLPALAQVLGGGALVSQLCQAAPGLMARPEVLQGSFVGLVTPKGDAEVASVMMLLQLCDKGNARACAERDELLNCEGGVELIAKAKECLTEANKAKGRV